MRVQALFCHATAQPKQRLGLADRPAPSSPPQMAPVHDITSTTDDTTAGVSELPSAQPASPSSMYLPMDTESPHVQLHSGADLLQPRANAAVAPAAADDAACQQASTTQAAASIQSQGGGVKVSPKDDSANASAAASFSGGDRRLPAGFDRQIHVFTREAIAAAEASNRYTILTLHAPHIIAACHMYQLCLALTMHSRQAYNLFTTAESVQKPNTSMPCSCVAGAIQSCLLSSMTSRQMTITRSCRAGPSKIPKQLVH